jgi:hypothetical protein
MEQTHQSHAANEGNCVSEREILAWRKHMLVEEPKRIIVISGAACFCAVVAWLLFRNPIFSAAALLMIASATSEYFFPVSYRLTDRAAAAGFGANRFEMEWGKVKRVLIYPDGVRLSPLTITSRLDSYRGIFLRFANDGHSGDRASVLAAIEHLRAEKQSEESV